MDITSLCENMNLPEHFKLIKQENINSYAHASSDFNPIHIDPEFAKKTELGGTVAHGMLVLAYVSSYMTSLFGKNWLTGGSLDIRFKAPARPGDILKISGKITHIIDDEKNKTISCDLICENQNRDAVITGEMKVRVKKQ